MNPPLRERLSRAWGALRGEVPTLTLEGNVWIDAPMRLSGGVVLKGSGWPHIKAESTEDSSRS